MYVLRAQGCFGRGDDTVGNPHRAASKDFERTDSLYYVLYHVI